MFRRLIFCMTCLALMGSVNLFAQTEDKPQLPNGNFNDAFVACYPWEKGATVTKDYGVQPDGWCASNVPNSLAGFVCQQVEGKDGGNAVELKNTAAMGNGIPAYLTLGTTWATAETKMTSTRNKDGGVFGGIPFTAKPTGIRIVYKRDGQGKDDVSTIVAYLWKGTWSQASVPSNTAVGVFGWGSATKVTMTDRDNNILGRNCLTGGAITKSDDAVLIASLNQKITGTVDEWQTLEIPFTYYDTEATPEKLNIVISAAGYMDDGAPITDGVSITIDRVELIYPYYSELESLSYNDTQITPDEYGNMTIVLESGAIFDMDKLVAVANDVDATVNCEYDQETGILKVTVKGADYESNPSNCHVYEVSVIIPKIYYSELESLTYNGTQITPDEYGSMIIVLESGAIFDMDKLVAVANDVDATVNCVYDKENGKVKVTVYGGDIDTNPSNYHEYTVIIDTTTGITDIENVVDAASASYNLAGQRVADNVKGIIIKNGKKHIQ